MIDNWLRYEFAVQTHSEASESPIINPSEIPQAFVILHERAAGFYRRFVNSYDIEFTWKKNSGFCTQMILFSVFIKVMNALRYMAA